MDDAFSRLAPEATAALQTDAVRLTRLPTYHVIPERFSPNNIDGKHAALRAGELTVTGLPNHL